MKIYCIFVLALPILIKGKYIKTNVIEPDRTNISNRALMSTSTRALMHEKNPAPDREILPVD